MTFKVFGAIFKNTPEKLQKRLGDLYDASKPYPNVDGTFGIKEEDRMAFASYVMNAEPNDRNEIPMQVSGYNQVSEKTGIKYLRLIVEPDFKTQKAIDEKMAAAGAAQSLADATGGTVVDVTDGDLF
jgi:hypothetical protein